MAFSSRWLKMSHYHELVTGIGEGDTPSESQKLSIIQYWRPISGQSVTVDCLRLVAIYEEDIVNMINKSGQLKSQAT